MRMRQHKSIWRKATLPAVAALVAAAGLAPSPSWAEPDPLYPLQNLLQVFSGPTAPSAEFLPDPFASPSFLPDWNHDGVYGNLPDLDSELAGTPAEGAFLYPCVADDGTVTYQTTSGTCAAAGTPGVTFRRGIAKRFKVTEAHGLALTAVLWLPGEALEPGASGFPSMVFANGGFVPQRSYYLYDMMTAAAGFVVLSYDSQGQGTSEGSYPQYTGPGVVPASGPCVGVSMACRELQEMVRWLTGMPIRPDEPTLGTHDPAANPANPALGVLDLDKVAIAGQSQGGVAASNYLYFLPTGKDADGQALPPIAAAVLLSGFGPARVSVPVQAQTADFDIPGIADDTLGLGVTWGPVGTKAWYDKIRATKSGTEMFQLIVNEGGSHNDTSNAPWTPHAVWSWSLTSDYFVWFLSCNVQHDAAACERVRSPRAHLSKAYASEYDPDGPAGASPSRCMTIPDKASLEQVLRITDPTSLPLGLLGESLYDCTPSSGG